MGNNPVTQHDGGGGGGGGHTLTCDEKMINCKVTSGFNPDEWSQMTKNCSSGDGSACDILTSKYDGEVQLYYLLLFFIQFVNFQLLNYC